jgi:hypothetical protein
MIVIGPGQREGLLLQFKKAGLVRVMQGVIGDFQVRLSRVSGRWSNDSKFGEYSKNSELVFAKVLFSGICFEISTRCFPCCNTKH